MGVRKGSLRSEVDRAGLWSLSQCLRSNLVTVPLTRPDDYLVHSMIAASLIPT